MKTLHPHQEEAIGLLRQSIRSGKRRPMLHLATGAGKTVIAAAIVRSALAKGNRVGFCVPALALIDQTVARFQDDGIEAIGVMQASHVMTDGSQPVQVISVDTLQNRDRPKCHVVLVDEAHRRHKAIEQWMADEPETLFIGLSATPWTKGLAKQYDDLVRPISMAELIELGFLSPFKVFAPPAYDLKGVKTLAGEYHQGQLGVAAMEQPKITADIARTWQEKAEGRPTLCFCIDRAHARAVRDAFAGLGVPTGYMDAFTPDEERKEIENDFRDGHLKVVCNVGVLTTGVDWDVRCIVLARPTKSEMLFVQIIGRGLRTAPGKDHCLILDHTGTHERLGFVTDIDHPELDDGKPKPKSETDPKAKEERLPKACPMCMALKAPGEMRCSSCGFKPERQTTVQAAQGDLVEMKPDRKATSDTKRYWWQNIRRYGLDRGKTEAWMAHRFREKFGVWPNAYRNSMASANLDPEVASWLKSRAIAYAKYREKQGRAA